jgi:RNA polymerase sigma-32 factor
MSKRKNSKPPESKDNSRNLPSLVELEVVEVDDEDVAIESDNSEIILEYADVETTDKVKTPSKKQKKVKKAKSKPTDSSTVVIYDPYKAYMAQLRNYPLMSADEEKNVATEYLKTRDPILAKRLVTANLRLVVKIAHEYHKAHYDLIDLIQEGNIGLLKAVQKFDPLKGAKLSTYSSWWIKAYILKYLLNNSRLVKIGTTQAQRKLFFNLNKQQEYLKAKGIVPTSENIALALDVSEKEVRDMKKRMRASDLSFSTPLSSDESGSRTVMDTIANGGQSPEEIMAKDEIHTIVIQKLSQFKSQLKDDLLSANGNSDLSRKVERELVIMEDRLLSENPLTLKKIGDRYGISRERARQLEKRLIGKLRVFLKEELGDNVEIALGFK